SYSRKTCCQVSSIPCSRRRSATWSWRYAGSTWKRARVTKSMLCACTVCLRSFQVVHAVPNCRPHPRTALRHRGPEPTVGQPSPGVLTRSPVARDPQMPSDVPDVHLPGASDVVVEVQPRADAADLAELQVRPHEHGPGL